MLATSLALCLLPCGAGGWQGPRVEVLQGDGLPAFSLTFDDLDQAPQRTPSLWLTGGSPSLYDPAKEPRFNQSEKHFHAMQMAARSRAGVRVVSAVLSFVGYAASPEIHPDGSLTPRTMTFLRQLLDQVPDSLLLIRIRLDLKPPLESGRRPGSVMLQSILNASHTATDWTASPTQAWAARLGNLTARVMVTLDAAFPGKVIGAQILHGVSYEGNYPGAWSAAAVEGKPAGSFDHMWPDYSPDAVTDYCRGTARPAGDCTLPTAAERNTPTLGSTLIAADSAAGASSIAFNRFINIQMASGIAAVGDAIKNVSDGKAFVTTLYGGSLFNGAAYATAGGSSAMTELLGMRGCDAMGNPMIYSPASRSDIGTMQPQSPWDSPLARGKLYVIEYDLRTYLDPPPGNTPASYDFLQTEEETADLLLHDFTSAAVRGHALYVLDPKTSCFYNATANGTDAIWAAVGRAVSAASLYKRSSSEAEGLAPEVAVFVDDASTAHWPLEISRGAPSDVDNRHPSARGVPGWPDLTLGNVPETFASLPFPVRYHLLSDLLSPHFTASRIKLAVLLNPLRVSDEVAAAIKAKLQVPGKTVLYSGAVGVFDGAGRTTAEGGRKLTGLTGLSRGPVKGCAPPQCPEKSSTVFAAAGESWPAAAKAAWAPAMKEPAGASWLATPWWFVNTSSGSNRMEVLGHHAGTQLPSLVQAQLGTHTAVYSANPALPTAAYLALALAAGVHSYTSVHTAETRVEAGGNVLIVHLSNKWTADQPPPTCEVALPFAATVHARNGSLVCTDCTQFTDCAIGRRTQVYTVTQQTADPAVSLKTALKLDDAVVAPPPRENIFPAGMLGFSSFRAVVLLQAPGRLFAFTTGRHAGGDVSARNVLVRSSAHGGRNGTWSAPEIIANLSAASLRAGDGLYLGTGAFDPVTQEVQLYWGECLERCHPGQTGAHVMAAPTFILSVAKAPFKRFKHINLTASVAKYAADPEAFLPFNFFQNAAVVWPRPQRQDGNVTQSAWSRSGTVLVGSAHNFSPKTSDEPKQGSVSYYSSDHGRTFLRGVELVPPPAPPAEWAAIDEPQLGLLSNCELIMVGHGDAQSEGRNTLTIARSLDNGRSWGPPRKIPGLVQPGCGLGLLVDTVAHHDVIYLSHDDNGTLASAGPNAHDASRNNLTISRSVDGGTSWVTGRHVDHRFTGLSALARVSSGEGKGVLGVLYEAGDKRFDGNGIWFSTLPLIR